MLGLLTSTALARKFAGVVSATSYVGAVANNTLLPTGLLTVASTKVAQKTVHQTANVGGINDIRFSLAKAYFGGTNNRLIPLPNDYTVNELSVRLVSGGTVGVVTKGGATSWTVSKWNGTTADSTIDKTDLFSLPANLPANTPWYVFLSLTPVGGTSLPAISAQNAALLYTDEACQNNSSAPATFTTAVTDTDANHRTRMAAIVMIEATRTGDVAGLPGDSEVSQVSAAYTVADGQIPTHNRGDLGYTVANAGVDYLNLGIGGDDWGYRFHDFKMQTELLASCTIVIPQLGINSVNGRSMTAATTLNWIRRAMVLFRGKKVIPANLTPLSASTTSTATITGTISGPTLNVATRSGVTIVEGMTVTGAAAGPSIMPYGTSGTNGAGDLGTYALSASSSGTPTACVGSFIAADGSDQTPTSGKATIVDTVNAGLGFSGLFSYVADRYSGAVGAAQKWYADGTSKRGTPDGLHVGKYLITTRIPAALTSWFVNAFANVTPLVVTALDANFALSGTPTFDGTYFTNGAAQRDDVFPGQGISTTVLRVKLGASLSSAHDLMASSQCAWFKKLTIATTGIITLQNVTAAATIVATTALTFNGETEVRITQDGTNTYLWVGGIYQGSMATSPAGTTNTLFGVTANSAKNVSIREVTIFKTCAAISGNYTPALVTGPAADCVVRWPLASDGVAVLGAGMPS